MKTKVKAHQEEMKDMTEAWVEELKACWEEMEASQEKTEAVAEHYEGVPCTEDTYLLTTQPYQCNWGLTWRPATGRRVPWLNDDMGPRWWVPAGVCHHHETSDPL
jgi:hypothetical protein